MFVLYFKEKSWQSIPYILLLSDELGIMNIFIETLIFIKLTPARVCWEWQEAYEGALLPCDTFLVSCAT